MIATRVVAGFLVVGVLGFVGCAATPEVTGTASGPTTRPLLVAPVATVPSPRVLGAVAGAYLDFATCDPVVAHQRTGTTHVYFFSRDDCADCGIADANLRATGVPDGVTVYRIDLPSMGELAARYGVTEPHTFVQVDADREKVTSWVGSLDGADIAAHLS